MVGTSVEDLAAINAEKTAPTVDPATGQPENGNVDFNRTNILQARHMMLNDATPEQVAMATRVCLSRVKRFFEEEPARIAAEEAARDKALNAAAKDDGQ